MHDQSNDCFWDVQDYGLNCHYYIYEPRRKSYAGHIKYLPTWLQIQMGNEFSP